MDNPIENSDLELFLTEESIPREELRNLPPQDIDFEKILLEIAFHEASHFVFDLLILKMNIGFSPITNIFVHCEQEQRIAEGRITGILSTDIISRLESFCIEKPKRIHAQIFSLIAGYASRLIFISKDAFFIGKTDFSTSDINGKVIYYKLDTAPIQRRTGISDIQKICQRLEYTGNTNKLTQNEAMYQYLEDVIALMKQPAIDLTIRFLKNIFLENNGIEINGKQLKEITRKANCLLSKVSLEDMIEKYLST